MHTTANGRLLIALALVLIWACITVFGGLAQLGQGSLADLVSQQVTWATPAAALFLLGSSRLLGWRDLGLNAPRPASSVKLFWLLALYILALAALAVTRGEVTSQILLFVAINTAFVGISEELAFRGVLWGAARRAMPFWPGVIFVSACFGSVHILNALITGEMGAAGIQALNAFLSGLAYLALRIRTRSLFPIMIAHWLWDLMIFLSVSGRSVEESAQSTASSFLGLAVVAPIAIYGLLLLRKRQFQQITDEEDGISSQGNSVAPKRG